MLRNSKLFPLLTLISVLVFLGSCGSDSDVAIRYEKTFVSSQEILTRTSGELQGFLKQGGFNIPFERLTEDVTLHRVNYKTTYQEQEVEASGLVIIPRMAAGTKVSILSFQHGTIFANNEAPTTSALNDLYLILYAAAASPGLVVVVPDYIGYGATKEIVHPYYITEPTVRAILDNIKAGREFMENSKLVFDGRLFLAGYSQGGFATMATHEAIEKQGFEDFTLKASYPAAGGYISSDGQGYSIDQVVNSVFTVFRIYSYLDYYETSYALLDFFKEPYASIIPGMFDGGKNSTEVSLLLNDTISVLYNNEFLMNSDSKYDEFQSLLEDNDVTNWKPRTKMVMFHSNQDNTVSVESSIATFDKFKASGSDFVTLVTVDGGDHLEAVVPYVEMVFNDLLEEL